MYGKAKFGKAYARELLSALADIAAACNIKELMDYHELIHPADAAAIETLKSLPGFNAATQLVMKLGVEQYCRALYMANHIRLSPKQLPRIYNQLPPICEKLGIEVPELYLQMYPTPNAYPCEPYTTLGIVMDELVVDGTESLMVMMPLTMSAGTGVLLTIPKSKAVLIDVEASQALAHVISCGMVKLEDDLTRKESKYVAV